jgi:hypothetical protein
MKLRGLVLSGSRDMDWWVWQFKQNPAGQAIISVAVNDDTNEIVGHFCHIPLRLKVETETHQVIQGIDIMVHPGFRRFGVYNRIRDKNHEIIRQKNVLLTYTFPSELMYRIHQDTRLKTIFKKTPLWIKPLNSKNIVTRYLYNDDMLNHVVTAIGKGLMKLIDRSRNYQIQTQIREIKEIDERFDFLWEQASSLHKIMMVRDRAYLKWRYIEKSDADYIIYVSEDRDKLLGYIVLRNVEDKGLQIGWIADILTSSKSSPASMDLLAKAVQYFKNIGIDVVLCVMPPKAYLINSLRKHIFFPISRFRKKIDAIRIRLLKPEYSDSVIYNPDNWYLTRGDSDLI